MPGVVRPRAAAATVTVGAAIVLGVLPPTAAAGPCADVELVFARGTGEPPGMGRVGDALSAALRGGGNATGPTGQFAGRAIDLCSAGDPICTQGRDRSAHNNYDGPPYLDQAANFVASLA